MLAFYFNRLHEACYRSYRMSKEWLKTISFIVFVFLLLQASNVHAGINTWTVEEVWKCIPSEPKGLWKSFRYSKTNVPKIFLKRCIEQITTEKPNGLKLLNSHQHRLQLLDRQHHLISNCEKRLNKRWTPVSAESYPVCVTWSARAPVHLKFLLSIS